MKRALWRLWWVLATVLALSVSAGLWVAWVAAGAFLDMLSIITTNPWGGNV